MGPHITTSPYSFPASELVFHLRAALGQPCLKGGGKRGVKIVWVNDKLQMRPRPPPGNLKQKGIIKVTG